MRDGERLELLSRGCSKLFGLSDRARLAGSPKRLGLSDADVSPAPTQPELGEGRPSQRRRASQLPPLPRRPTQTALASPSVSHPAQKGIDNDALRPCSPITGSRKYYPFRNNTVLKREDTDADIVAGTRGRLHLSFARCPIDSTATSVGLRVLFMRPWTAMGRIRPVRFSA